jgi:hypothetical protein
MPATARVTILMDPAEKRALETRAKRENVSLGELIRRAALAPKQDEDAALRAAVDMLRKSNATAKAALDLALSNIDAREKAWPERERKAVAKGRALAAEWQARA